MNEEGGGQTLNVKPGDFVVNGGECGQVVEIGDVFADVVKLKGHIKPMTLADARKAVRDEIFRVNALGRSHQGPPLATECPQARLTDEERNMAPHERHALWQSDARGRNVRIRCTRRPTAQEERRSLLREHADGSCHDTRLDWWPAGSWRRK